MFTVDIQNDIGYTLKAAKLVDAAMTVLEQQQADPDTGMTVVIAEDVDVAELNEQYRGIAAPTDVLSFPAEALPEDMDDEPPYIGDLVIAYDYAAAQAKREGHDLDESLALLVIHGTLHLLGYDHDTPENRAKMWAEQDKALDAMGISRKLVPALEGESHDSEAE